MSSRKGLRRGDDGTPAAAPVDNITQSQSCEDMPPAWFLSEMEKGFSRIHDMVEDRLSNINKVVEKIHNEHSAINEKLADLSAKQSEYEATAVDLPEHDRPRALVIRLLRSSDTEKILAAARQLKKLEYGNSTIMVFRDVSTALYKRRKAFTDLKKLLQRCDIKYSLLYPATLRIDLSGGRRSFTSPKSAETYLRQHHPEYF
ncbi:unnamed protein product [Leuciscus chuanchicus]